jgi:hypothetical protein
MKMKGISIRALNKVQIKGQNQKNEKKEQIRLRLRRLIVAEKEEMKRRKNK